MRFSPPILAIMGVVARQTFGADAYAMLCSWDSCSENFTSPCADVTTTYRLYGSCCSLRDVGLDDGTVGCQLTVAGNGTSCNFRDPDYSCDPEEGCFPEYNVLGAETPGVDCPASDYAVPTERPETETEMTVGGSYVDGGDADIVTTSSAETGGSYCPHAEPAKIRCVLTSDESVGCGDIPAPSNCGSGNPVYDHVKYYYDAMIDNPPGAQLVQSVRYREPMTSSSFPYEKAVPPTNYEPGKTLIPSGVGEGHMYKYAIRYWESDVVDLCKAGPYETTFDFETTGGDSGGPNCKSSDTHTWSIAQAPTPAPAEGGVCSLEMQVGCYLDSAYALPCEEYDRAVHGPDCVRTVYYRYTLRNPAPTNSPVVLTFSEAVRVREGSSDQSYLSAMEKYGYQIPAAPGPNTFIFPETYSNYDVCARGAAAMPPTTFRVAYTSNADGDASTCNDEETYDPATAGMESGSVSMSAGEGEEGVGTSGARHVCGGEVASLVAMAALAVASLAFGVF